MIWFTVGYNSISPRYQQNGLCQAVGSSGRFFRVITQGRQKTKHFSTPDALRSYWIIINTWRRKTNTKKYNLIKQNTRRLDLAAFSTWLHSHREGRRRKKSTPDALSSDWIIINTWKRKINTKYQIQTDQTKYMKTRLGRFSAWLHREGRRQNIFPHRMHSYQNTE